MRTHGCLYRRITPASTWPRNPPTPIPCCNWYENLIRLRREVPALRDGAMRMVDCHNVAVVCYVRKTSNDPAAAVVALNMSGSSQTAAIDLSAEGPAAHEATTLLTDGPGLSGAQHLASLPLAPFASWIGSAK